MSDKLFDIPEGWEMVTPLQRTLIVHPTEFKIYDEDKLIHYFVFVTDFVHFRVFDRVTGEFKKHRKLRKQKMFKSMEAEIEQDRKEFWNERYNTELPRICFNANCNKWNIF